MVSVMHTVSVRAGHHKAWHAFDADRSPRKLTELEWTVEELRKKALPKATFTDSVAGLTPWVISLDGAQKRRSHFEEAARAQSLNFDVVPAVNGSAQLPSNWAAFHHEVRRLMCGMVY